MKMLVQQKIQAGFAVALALPGGVAWLDFRHVNHMQVTAAGPPAAQPPVDTGR
jgi:hypothetical protein